MVGTRGGNADTTVNKPRTVPALMGETGQTKVRNSVCQIFMSCHKGV